MRLKIKNDDAWEAIPTDRVDVLSDSHRSMEIINTIPKEENINDK